MTTATLDEIGLRHGTDKSSRHHDYLKVYEPLFAPLRDKPLTILEIGVLNGASLRTWREYFPAAHIVGADIDPLARLFRGPRVDVEYMDQSNLEDLIRVGAKHQPFDLIIEDGSHIWDHQILTLRTLFPFLRAGGFYVVEDLQTNYGEMVQDYRGMASESCVEFLKRWLDYLVADNMLSLQTVEDAFLRTYGRAARSISFYKRMCVIEKRELPLPPGAREFGPLAPPASGGEAVRVSLVAHVSHVGDVLGTDGYIDLGRDLNTFQGIVLNDSELALEYRVLGPDRVWGPWVPSPEFAGTRGRSQLLYGVAVRLRETAKDKFALRVIGRFVGADDLVFAGDGEDCVAANGGELRGLQVELTRPPAKAD